MDRENKFRNPRMSLHEKWMRPQLAFPKAKQEAVSPQQQQQQQQQKKKPLKVRLKETQEELRIEKEAREELDKENTKLKEENTKLKEERNFFIKELDKMEQLRCCEMKLYKALLHEEVYKMKMETENLRATLKTEEQEKFKRLEQAMDLEREQWKQEREKLLIDKENLRMQHDDMEKQKLEIEATWKEHNDCWAKKTSTMLDMIEDKSEMINKLKRMVELLQKDAEMKKHGVMDEVKIPSKNKQNCFFPRFFQNKKIREEEEQIMEIERLVLQRKESRAKQDDMAYVMEAILEEMNEMKRSLAEKEGIELEYEKERKEFQAEKEKFTIKLENQTKNLEEERKRCNILESSWREHSDQVEQKIMEKDRLLEKKNKEMEVLKRTMEAQQINYAQALEKEEVLMEEKDKPKRRPVDEKEMEVTECIKPREEPEENIVMDIVLEREEDMEMVKGSREGHGDNHETGA
ncbi:golgin subfamily A member 6-like protein 22 [Tachysurus fulvidraco]|uniref:golgin subfamily A member 6-like protein 22 n=1 Tax=Tachysurus fulvidraco TaxID=1234273 RepID=UPI001FEE9764|nr:golgin subfamily A member 6-like protein 22 [Tachysurus fulvidraco]